MPQLRRDEVRVVHYGRSQSQQRTSLSTSSTLESDRRADAPPPGALLETQPRCRGTDRCNAQALTGLFAVARPQRQAQPLLQSMSSALSSRK
eukprot:15424832-Heterocapsa_arctica.AAC.1